MRPTISIIIPTYNRVDYLLSLLHQLTSQTEPAHQIIVVDDHSTDTTAQQVTTYVRHSSNVFYVKNRGHHQRDAKQSGLYYATGEYIGFFDDDAVIEDSDFFARLRPLLEPGSIVQAKVILEQMGKNNLLDLGIKDIFASRPYPIFELVTSNLNRGRTPRSIFPLIEWGNFWHRSLWHYFIDENFVKDAYGESYSASMQLYRAGIKLRLYPELIIRHPGATSGGSHKFNKKAMTKDFTEFHFGYFYNMIYLHRRFWPNWQWLWLPYFLGKSLIALAINRNISGWQQYAFAPIKKSLSARFSTHQTLNTKQKIFIWQGGWRGGAERITLEAAKFFQQQGFSVALGVYQPNQTSALPQIRISVPQFIPISFRSFYASLVFRARYAKNYDAVYSHTLGMWQNRKNRTFVHEAADPDIFQANLNNPLKKLAAYVWRSLYLNFTLKSATAIFAASEQTRHYCLHHGIPSEIIKDSASFYNEEIFRFLPRNPQTPPWRLIFIGNYQDPRKNFRLIYQTFYNHPRFRVTVLGGPARQPDSNIKFFGYQSQQGIRDALAEAHIFIMPSSSEGFSVALLEALATGIPCLVNQSAINQELKNIVNLIPYQSQSDLIEITENIIKKYQQYNRFDNKLNMFTRSSVLQREINHIKPFLNITASHKSSPYMAQSEKYTLGNKIN